VSKGSEFASVELNVANYFASKKLVEGSGECFWAL